MTYPQNLFLSSYLAFLNKFDLGFNNGYSKRPGTEITDFTPDDTDTMIYLESMCGFTFEELLEKAKAKWPDANMSNISISSEKIHTHCIYYDLHDGSDYTDYITLTYTGN